MEHLKREQDALFQQRKLARGHQRRLGAGGSAPDKSGHPFGLGGPIRFNEGGGYREREERDHHYPQHPEDNHGPRQPRYVERGGYRDRSLRGRDYKYVNHRERSADYEKPTRFDIQSIIDFHTQLHSLLT